MASKFDETKHCIVCYVLDCQYNDVADAQGWVCDGCLEICGGG